MTLRRLSSVAEELNLEQHVLRYWERQFGHLRPMRHNRRYYYRPEDVEMVQGIRILLHDRGLTLEGLRRVFQERGPGFVRLVGSREIHGSGVDTLAASLAIIDLPPQHQAALIDALIDPARCRELANRCLIQDHQGGAIHA